MPVDELPSHKHALYVGGPGTNWETKTITDVLFVWNYHNAVNYNAATYTGPVHYDSVGYAGRNQTHNTLSPSKAAYIWYRTA